jgi:transcriptional regulator
MVGSLTRAESTGDTLFVPDLYQVPDDGRPLDVVRRYPLATLLSNGSGVPYATHVPVIAPEGAGAGDRLAGAELLVHLNRANPHSAVLTDGSRAKLVFHGPDGYVTPCLYGLDEAAPTWDFVSVHAVGRIRLARDADEVLGIVGATARALEGRFGGGFDFTASAGYFATLAPGVDAFRFTVESFDAMFKLSQEKDAVVRDRVARHFAASGRCPEREMARLMHAGDASQVGGLGGPASGSGPADITRRTAPPQ